MSFFSSTEQRRLYLTGILMAGLGSALFSGKAILIKLAYSYGTEPETLLALRMIFALPLFWALYYWQSRTKPMSPITKLDILKLCGLGFLGYFLSSYLDFLGLQYISVGLERIILYLTPTLVLLISYFVFKKRISRIQWLALITGYLGVTLVFIQDVAILGSEAWLGMTLVFASACSYAAYMIGSGEMVRRIGSVRLVVFASSASAVCSVIQILFYRPSAIFTQAPEIYGLSLINASICTVIPMTMIVVAINRIGSPLVAQAGIVGPISTIFMGWLVLSETVSLLQLGGMLIVIVAMWLLVKNDPTDKVILAKSTEVDGR
jgi:drug/metabolite transporter (DMT)-like permease